MADLEIIPEYAVFCDLIRREDTGKMIFIGAYTQGLAISSFPQTSVFMVYLHGRFEGRGSTDIELRIIYKESEELIFKATARSTPPLDQAPDLKFETSTPLIPCEVSKPETVVAQIRCAGGKWQDFGSLNISLARTISPTASPQPSARSRPGAPAS